MSSKDILIKPIGIVHSPYKVAKGTPIQSSGSITNGEIELFEKYQEGLADLKEFSHIIILYQFHKLITEPIRVNPFMDTKTHGVFATRSPARPNKIGFSVVKLEKIIDNRLVINNVDMLDGTPVIDIKPYVPQFDSIKADKIGWLENHVQKYNLTKDDGRFI